MNEPRLTGQLRHRLAEAGLSGSFLVRDLATGQEIGIDPDVQYPIASLVKVPLAVAVLERIRAGRLDGARAIEIPPGPPGPTTETGLGRFRHPARIAVRDLLYLSIAISDNSATDVLFGLVPPAEVNRGLAEAGITGITVRHRMGDLADAMSPRPGPDSVHLAQVLASGARTAGRGHPVPRLDVTRANAGSARAFAGLLQALWTPSRIPGETAAGVRDLMRGSVLQQRLGPDFISDASVWSSKSGTLLNLRHDIGVVEHEDGSAFALAALTESSVPAAAQPAAEAVMGNVARALHDHLRELTAP